MQKHTYYLAKYMARAGVAVDLYLTASRNIDLAAADKLFTQAERKLIALTPVAMPPSYRFPGHYVYESYLRSKQIWQALQYQLNVDFIYAQGFAGWEALKIKKSGKTLPPIGVNFHGFEMYQKAASLRTRMEHLLLRPFVRRNLKMADTAIVLGRQLAPIAQNISGVQQMVESANGVTSEWLKPELEEDIRRRDPGRLVFVFLGRYERRKGIEELHEAITRLHTKHDFTFEFIGPIPEEQQLKTDRVRYHGLVREEQRVRDILQRADVLVCPSYAEGMPTVILEAMASGLAVIASGVGAIEDLVDESNGWIVPPGDGQALRRAMVAAMSSAGDSIAEKREASMSKVRQHFLWHRVASQTIKNIESVL